MFIPPLFSLKSLTAIILPYPFLGVKSGSLRQKTLSHKEKPGYKRIRAFPQKREFHQTVGVPSD